MHPDLHRAKNSSPPDPVKDHRNQIGVDSSSAFTKRKRHDSPDEDAVSEWETVAPEEELNEYPELPIRQLRRRKNFEFIYHTRHKRDLPEEARAAEQGGGISLLQTAVLDFLPARPTTCVTNTHSFTSVSSLYSDISEGDEVNTDGNLDRKTVTKNRQSDLGVTCSRASSSTSGDPFKYDRDIYSGFLQPSAERDVSDALQRIGTSSYTKESTVQITEIKHPGITARKAPGITSFYDADAIRST